MFDHNCSCKVAINMLLVGEGGLGKMYPDSNIDFSSVTTKGQSSL